MFLKALISRENVKDDMIDENDTNLSNEDEQEQEEEVWVESKTSDNRNYYYNAATRETTWTRPSTQTGRIRIISQLEIDKLNNTGSSVTIYIYFLN